MTRQRAAFAAALAVSLVSAGAILIMFASQPSTPATGRPPAGDAVLETVRAAPPRVAELMTRAGCDGAVIGTQLYSRETGRCTLRGASVTVAAFDTDALRDQWVEAGRQFGGTFVRGPKWAAGTDQPDRAGELAQALGGTLVV